MLSLSHRLFSAFLQLFFNLLYNQFAWTYDLVAAGVSLGRWRDWVLTPLPELGGPRVLELGHGPGHLQKALAGRSGIVSVGLDNSAHMGFMAMRNFTAHAGFPNLVNAVSQGLPFADHAFDQVVATFPTEYILVGQTLSNIRRVLNRNGKLVIVPVAWITGKRLLDRLAAWLFKITGQAGDIDADYEDYIGVIEQAGFRVEAERRKLSNSEVLLIKAFPNPNPLK